jgi:hypothetical protein
VGGDHDGRMEIGGTEIGGTEIGGHLGLDPNFETLKIETHCSERRFGWQVPEFSGWNIGLQ